MENDEIFPESSGKKLDIFFPEFSRIFQIPENSGKML